MPLKYPKTRFIQRRPLFSSSVPKSVAKPKMKWRILPILWTSAKRMAMVLGFMVLLSSFISIWTLASLSSSGPADLPDSIVLTLPFGEGLSDVPEQAGFSSFGPPPPSVYQILEAIEAAKDDPRVKSIVATLGEGGLALSHIEEIRTALKDFRESGKPTYIYAPSYGEAAGGLGRYYLASAFETIWMQPMGVVSIPGINAEVPYFRGVLDTLGISPQFFQRHEYKTAYESVTSTEMTPENREMLEDMVTNLRRVLVHDIAADRGMSEAAFEALVDKGLFTGPAALASRLIDKLDYEDVLSDNLIEHATGEKPEDVADEDLPFVDVAAYGAELEAGERPDSDAPKAALVYASGAIMQTEGASGVAAADVLAPAILEAADDEAVTTIILRIDSPGGSPTASESILRALDKAKAKGKTIIVSMGPTAASGGYWIAAKADRIFALPTTITGSIGVLGGKLALEGMWDKVAINWDTVSWGRNAGIWSFNTPFSVSEAVQVNAMLDDVYESFLARVAEGRKMSVVDVDRIARGRVWTGEAALERGLVDELGGLIAALDFAAKEAGLESRADMTVEIFPKPLTPFEKLAKLLGSEGSAVKVLEKLPALVEFLSPLLEAISVATAPQDYGVYERVRVK